MDTRQLGPSDLQVSVVGMGCNNFSRPKTATETQEGSTAVIHAAIDAGINFFDGADIYGTPPGTSERFIGAALTGGRRDKVVLSTKFGHVSSNFPEAADWGPKGGERYIRNAVDASLGRLATDRIDLLQMHSPDPETPIGDTLSTLTALVEEGKVRYVGNSNFTATQLEEADQVARDNGFVRFVSAQNEYSLVRRGIEADVLPVALKLGIGVFPYFPLFNGLFTGKYTRDGGQGRLSVIKPQLLEAVDWDQLDAYQKLCDDAGVTMLEATFAWFLSHPAITCVIAGATTAEQAEQNAAAGAARLSDDVIRQIGDLFA